MEEIKKREGFELVMEVGLLVPHLVPCVKPHKRPVEETGKQPLPSAAFLIRPLSPSLSTCASGLCLPACGGRRGVPITAKGCLRWASLCPLGDPGGGTEQRVFPPSAGCAWHGTSLLLLRCTPLPSFLAVPLRGKIHFWEVGRQSGLAEEVTSMQTRMSVLEPRPGTDEEKLRC